MTDRIILDLCGGTGGWSKPYSDAGYDVRIITFPEHDARLWPSKPSHFPNRGRFPVQFDSIEGWIGDVQGILCAPVCTVLSGSGACHPRTDADIIEALSLCDACIRICHVIKPVWWALENPVGKLRKWHGPPVMTFNPCDYGDPYKKRTLLWGNFCKALNRNPVKPVIPSPLHQNYGGKSAKTKEVRSKTPPGFAKAFFEANR